MNKEGIKINYWIEGEEKQLLKEKLVIRSKRSYEWKQRRKESYVLRNCFHIDFYMHVHTNKKFPFAHNRESK